MVATHDSPSQKVRAQLDHPIIDADGHTVELVPVLMDYLKEVGGSKMPERYETFGNAWDKFGWAELSDQERRDRVSFRPPWWFNPTKSTVDRATSYLPKLLNERMDELGIDFAMLYPTSGAGYPLIEDDELRQSICRALNKFNADYFREYSHRMAAPAVIPMHTPQEAIAELEYAVNTLGFKAIVIGGHVRRIAAKVKQGHPEEAMFHDRQDVFGMDSDYDYDPFWARCVELKVAPTDHSSAQGWESRRSTSSYVFNHIGSFAVAQEPLAKALILGGVTRRFPTLNFGFLESGVGWACGLYADLIGHWSKRGLKSLKENLDPDKLDLDGLMELFDKYGEKMTMSRREDLRDQFGRKSPPPALLDEFGPAKIEKAEDIYDLFVQRFYFGCEADDPMNAWAFNDKVNPFGARLNAMMSSDIGHWDVPDMQQVVAEAYELVEHGLLTEDDFRDFTFANPVRFWAGMNPDFFKGTAVEDQAARLLAEQGNGLNK